MEHLIYSGETCYWVFRLFLWLLILILSKHQRHRKCHRVSEELCDPHEAFTWLSALASPTATLVNCSVGIDLHTHVAHGTELVGSLS